MFFHKQPKLEIIIGQESTIRGEIASKGTVRIDGLLEGNISADCVIIGEKGMVTGDAVVRLMVIGGRIVATSEPPKVWTSSIPVMCAATFLQRA